MRVLILTASYPSINRPAAHIFTHSQAKAIQKQGVDVAVLEIDMRSIRRSRRFGFSKDNFDGITVYRMAIPCGPIPYILPLLAKIGLGYAFEKITCNWKPDIIHAHFGSVGFWAARLKRKHGIPLVLTEHNSGIVRGFRTKKTERYSKIAYENADVLITVGTIAKESMADLTNKTVVVMPNIIPPYFCYKNVPKLVNYSYVSVGSLIDRKRFDITINAFGQVNKKHPDTRLKIIGDGKLREHLLSLAKENNIEDALEFSGILPNDILPDIYNICHCFVLLSTHETFGVVYAEAIACGLPVIASKCGGPEDFIDIENGLLIPVDDLNAAIGAMEHMYYNSGHYNSDKISKDILSKTNEGYIGKKLVEIYTAINGGCK